MERPRPHREKPARQRHKPPILGHFSYAGRTLSRSHPPSGRAGRTFSHTGHSHVATVKPPSPLRPLMQANVKPPSPMQPKNASKTPISHPQRRCRFHLRLALREQRRRRFHARDFQCPRAMAGPGRATGGRPTLQTRQTNAIPIASRGPLLQTSSIQTQKPPLSAKKPLD